MKIFFVLPIRGPINGVKVISSYLMSAFKKEFDTELIDTAQAKGYADFGKFKIEKILSIFTIINRFRKISRNDIVYLNFSTKGFSFYRDFILLKAILIRTKKVYIHIHANGLESKLKSPYLKTLNQTKVIVINHKQYESLQNLNNLHLIENALPNYYKNRKLQKPNNEFLKLVFISNLSKEKGAVRLKQTCDWIREKNIKAQLKIAGGVLDTFSQEIIDEIKKLSFVEYLGPIHKTDKKMQLLLESDVLLMLSDKNYEVSPLVYIEALMNGCAIMTTEQIVSKNFTTEKFGYHWTFENLQKIERLYLQDRQGQNISQSAHEFYLKNYTFEDYFKQIKNILLDE